MEDEVLSNLVVRDGLAIVSNGSHAPLQIPLVDLPPVFLQWQLASRGTLFHQHMAHGDRVARFDAHLPVVVTISTYGPFLAHTANKGTGLLPREGYIAEDIRAMKALLNRVKDWKQSLRERVTFMSSLYAEPQHWDRRYLGSLEIFQGQTYQNVAHDPRVSLHYTGGGPEYPSFQINAVAEIVHPDDPRFEFLYLARQLFEYDAFHIQQPHYPSGYLFWVCAVFDKSPRGEAGQRIA